MMDAAPDEIVILYPNGGESLTLGEEYTIKWKTYGSVSSVDLAYSTGSNPAEDDWNDIASGEVNVDSLTWSPVTISDSIRIRVRDPDSFDENVGKYKTEDISGWYFSVSGGMNSRITSVRPGDELNGKGFSK